MIGPDRTSRPGSHHLLSDFQLRTGHFLAGARDLAQTLKQLGEARVLYSTDQHVNLAGDKVNIGATVPMTTASRTTEQGRIVNTVSMHSVGAIFSIKGHRAADGTLEMTIRVEIASLSESTTSIGENITAPIIRQIVMNHQGSLHPGEPVIFYSADAATGNEKEQAMVYVTRLVLGRQ